MVRVAAAHGHRPDDVGGHDLSVAAVRAAQRDGLRRRAAQGRHLVQGDRPARVAGRRGRFARQGRRHHRAHRRARRRGPGRGRAGEREGRQSGAGAGAGGRTRRRGAVEAQPGPACQGLRLRRRRGRGKGARGKGHRGRGQCARHDRRHGGVVAQRAGLGRLHGDPRAVRRRDPVQERQRRRSRHAVLQRGRLEGRGGVDGRHEHAGGRGRRRRIEPVQDQRSASRRRSCSTRFPTRAFAAASAASCRRWTAPRPR